LPREMEYLSLRELAIGGTLVSVAFERVGDRVMAAPIGFVPETVEIIVRA